jgi:death-on-curing protein
VIDYLDLVDYLLIAEAVTGIPAETLAKLPRIDLADSALHAPRAEFGGVEFYPEFAVKAAVLCARLLRNHPLPDGNKRAAWVSLQEFIARNGYSWSAPSVDEAEAVVVAVASGEMSEADLAAWLVPKIVSP